MASKELEVRGDRTPKSNRPRIQNEIFEDCKLVFRNFKGRESMYNREGDRNFCIILDPDRAADLEQIGWNVRTLKAMEEDGEPTPYIQVSVGYKIRPPHVSLITSRGRADLGEDEIEALDYVDVEFADAIVRPYEWSVNGRTGIKAYLKTLYVKIQEDYLELKYADLEELSSPGEALEVEVLGGVDRLDDEEGLDIVDAELVD